KITEAAHPCAASPDDGDLHASRSSSMHIAVHHLRRRSIKRARVRGVAALTLPRLRSSMMAGATSTPARTKSSIIIGRGCAGAATPLNSALDQRASNTRLIHYHARTHGRGQRDTPQIHALRGGGLGLLQIRDQRVQVLLQRAYLEARLADRAMHDA